MTALDQTVPAVAHGVARRCPVCDADGGDVLFVNRMAPIADIDFTYAVVACGACGMVRASHAPEDATLDRYYRDFSKYDLPRAIEDVNAADVDRAKVAAAFTRRVLPAGRVLDVGCATGVFLSVLERSSYEVRGLDPSPTSADVARELFGVAVDVAHAREYDRYDAFDCVTLLAVLEHLREPGRLLSTIARQMKPGALLIVEVPNADLFASYPAVGRESEPYGEFSNEHINFFGDASLRRLAGRAGLSWVASEEFPYVVGIRGLIAAFRKDGRAVIDQTVDHTGRTSVQRYIAASAAALREVESQLERVLARPIVLYGAGSHSARLLAQGRLRDARIDVVLDRNAHLAGRTIGGHEIRLPTALTAFPDRPVVVSSFHSMAAIARDLRSNHDNEIVTLYPERDAPLSAAHARARR